MYLDTAGVLAAELAKTDFVFDVSYAQQGWEAFLGMLHCHIDI